MWEPLERDDTPAPAGPWAAVRFHASRAAVAVALAAVTYVLFPASPAVDFPLLEVGAVAPDNVIAPFAYTVRKGEAEPLTRSVPALTAVGPG